MDKELMELYFTSYRESIDMRGLKLSLDRHSPKLCQYPAMSYMTMVMARDLTVANIRRICSAIMDNNWNLISAFINDMHDLGLRRLIFCDWSTKEQIAQGKFCFAGIIGQYIQSRIDNREFKFPVEIDYGDGRVGL